ncbi:MAG: hypothetical protein GX783_10395 [Clostridiales bacterium]|nr:hypothetical protein [Clostridiales bacterium]
MGYGKFGLKLFGSHVLMSVVQFFLYFLIFGVFPDSELYQWIIGIMFIALFCLVIYADASHYGQNDLKRDRFSKSKGFIAGLIASIPGLILYILALALPSVWLFDVLLRAYLIPYIKLIITFQSSMPAVSIIFILFFPIVTGLSYLDGIRRRNKIKEAIAKKDAMRGELSKGDIFEEDKKSKSKEKYKN